MIYTFMPLFSILVVVFVWPLKHLIQGLHLGGDIDSEPNDPLHSDNEVGDL